MGTTSRRILVTIGMIVALCGPLSTTAAGQNRRREPTPNLGQVFPRRPPGDDPMAVAAALRRFTRTEARLFAARSLDATALAEHWRKLSRLRLRLERLEATGRLDDDPELHQALAQLFERPVAVDVVGDGAAEERLREAAEMRLRNLVGMAQLANRRLGFQVREILGVSVVAAES